ncbi:hypothetical protein WA026_021869 [Henosepilachna vigintioctopunctata]|uniref:Uncharacterized protein n=1 Tax=Henosepilachna vigintioctopunctata TaxID=420089 RepID=A0AAW1UG06_9CUCU
MNTAKQENTPFFPDFLTFGRELNTSSMISREKEQTVRTVGDADPAEIGPEEINIQTMRLRKLRETFDEYARGTHTIAGERLGHFEERERHRGPSFRAEECQRCRKTNEHRRILLRGSQYLLELRQKRPPTEWMKGNDDNFCSSCDRRGVQSRHCRCPNQQRRQRHKRPRCSKQQVKPQHDKRVEQSTVQSIDTM